MLDDILSFLANPFPLWETKLTNKLVAEKYQTLAAIGILKPDDYSTASVFNAIAPSAISNKSPCYIESNFSVNLEKANFDLLGGFYEDHGLVPIDEPGLREQNTVHKLRSAIKILAKVPECLSGIAMLVNCIQIIKSDGPEYDASYSHPDIPFTIFVSVCNDDSEVSNIRVAEGILHEAMHLKLTLIEKKCSLIDSETETYYSPWRDEHRPLRGVLHGAFVFRAIMTFFDSLLRCGQLKSNSIAHLTSRISEIKHELGTLDTFPLKSLTKQGKNLAMLLTQ